MIPANGMLQLEAIVHIIIIISLSRNSLGRHTGKEIHNYRHKKVNCGVYKNISEEFKRF